MHLNRKEPFVKHVSCMTYYFRMLPLPHLSPRTSVPEYRYHARNTVDIAVETHWKMTFFVALDSAHPLFARTEAEHPPALDIAHGTFYERPLNSFDAGYRLSRLAW